MTPDRLAQVCGVDLTSATVASLQGFVDIVTKWTPKINLVSRSSLSDIWVRHVADSAQLFRLIPASARRFIDLGSGGGFPGIVLAVLLRQERPDSQMVLIESDQRKAAFLREAVRLAEVNVEIICARTDQVSTQRADVVSARALSPLPDLLGQVHLHLAGNGVAILPKGASFQEEVDRAGRQWTFDLDVFPSQTDLGARVLRVTNLSRRTGSNDAS